MISHDIRGSLNQFAYCWNNPIFYVDVEGNDPSSAVAVWIGGMWWLTLVDGFLPIGDLVYIAGSVVLGAAAGYAVSEIIDNIELAPAKKTASQGGKNSAAAAKSVSTPASPTPPGNNRRNNSQSNKHVSGQTYNKYGIRVEYEYNGNGTGNVHVHYQGKKYQVYRLEGGNVYSLPKSLQNNKAVLIAINKGITFLRQLGGLL